MKLTKYFSIWLKLAINAMQETFINRTTSALFFSGKAIRFAMMLLFLMLLRTQLNSIGYYTTDHLVIFYLTYYFVDLFGQMFYRGVYQFGQKVRTGEFDFYLLKPISPLFQSLAGKPDINDALFFLPSLLISVYIASQLSITITLTGVAWFILLFINSLLIVTGLHMLVLAIAILTVDVDGIIWLYRDISKLSQFPVSIYFEPLRTILFFVIPVGFMVTIPAEILIGNTPTFSLAITFAVGILFFTSSYIAWKQSLKHYTSASS
jgi:ABC-2 type transport system permease protein